MAQGNNPLWEQPPDEAGTYPGLLKKMPQSWWKDEHTFKWGLTGKTALNQTDTVWEATWYSPLFDLRPEFAETDERVNAGVPINRSPALGGGVFMRILFVDQPAFYGDTDWFVRMEGHVYRSRPLYRLTEEIDITTTINAGGYTSGNVVGASPFDCEPPASGIRFWRVIVRAEQTAVPGATPRPYGLHAAVY